MTQSMIYFVVGLAVLSVAGFMVAQRYRRDHPEEAQVYPQNWLVMLFVLSEEVIHLRDLMQYQETAPHDGWSRRVVMLAIQMTAEHGDP
ncbi:hypothetical protein B0G74_9164 [Paraburkholderia sp. BL9I2N2]|nr:hypothetical protein B0G74_9164 [Paraburkholderia sp. BL9I2N2]